MAALKVAKKFASSGRERHTKHKRIDNESSSDSFENDCDTGQDVFRKGALVRVLLHNFLTFDDVQFEPCAQLNVVVGPNGTGKSSLMCAICLGLGGAPRLLGRAKDVKHYVKNGKDTGFVEIELANPRGRNRVIRRIMSAAHNNSSWTIDGREAREKDVFEIVKEMNIQLSNKCQFLPQDMVVEFAKMDECELLEETEKTIGPEHASVDLFGLHQQLKEKQRSQSTVANELGKKKDTLIELQRQNQLVERDVQRYRERQKYLQTIEHLKLKKLWVEYMFVRDQWTKAKSERKRLEEVLKRLKAEMQPLKDKHKEKEGQLNSSKQLQQAAVKALNQAKQALKNKQDELNQLEDEVDGPQQELEKKKHEEAQRMKNISVMEKEIEIFAHEMEQLEDAESIQTKLAEKHKRMRDIQTQIDGIKADQQQLLDEKRPLEDKIRRAEDMLRRMGDVRKQRLDKVRQRNRDVYEAVMWLSENQHRFKQPIFEPIMLQVNVRDQTYVRQVEAALSGRDALSFVAQNPEDYEAFTSIVHDNMKLKVNSACAPSERLDYFKPSVSFEVLKEKYHFEKRVIDLIEVPEPLLCFFCKYHHLQDLPIAGNLGPADIQRVIHEVKQLQSFFTASSRYMVRHSKYSGQPITKSSDLMDAFILSGSVDLRQKEVLEREIREAQQALEVIAVSYRELEQQDVALRQEDNRLRKEKNELLKVKDNRKKLEANIESRRTKLTTLRSSSFDLKVLEEQCEEAVRKVQEKRVLCFNELVAKVHVCLEAAHNRIKAGLDTTSVEVLHSYLTERYQRKKIEWDNAEQEYEKSKEKESTVKTVTQNKLTLAKSKSNGVENPMNDERLSRIFNTLPEDLGEIDDKIHEYHTMAELCFGDEGVLKEYEEREKRIERLQEEVKEEESSVDRDQQNIDGLKQSWLEPLRKLIDEKVSAKFAEFFRQMNCAGEVRLKEHEDFGKYGVEILVKFRSSEELQALSAHRQSGGKGVAVDEINQGMDPANERRIFDLIVQTASQQNTSQYFLLTPKLLQNLNYSPAVRVHIVANGQEMVEYSEWNMDRFLL
ncbi:hypothetical protein EMCRGX_G022483 [Ephydatia muelleri]